MEARASYNDFTGTVAADVEDHIALSNMRSDDLTSIAKFLKLDEDRFKLVGLSFYGTSGWLSLLCVDKQKSTDGNEHMVKMSIDHDNGLSIFKVLFKNLEIILYDKHDNHYRNLERAGEEIHFEDFHETKDVEILNEENAVRHNTTTITNACITTFTVSENGYQGGDAGHGGFVEIKIEDKASTAMEAAIITRENREPQLEACSSLIMKFSGDAERDNLIEGLEFILDSLKR